MICCKDWSVGKHDYSKTKLRETDVQTLYTVVSGMLIIGAMSLHAKKIKGKIENQAGQHIASGV